MVRLGGRRSKGSLITDLMQVWERGDREEQ